MDEEFALLPKSEWQRSENLSLLLPAQNKRLPGISVNNTEADST
jgi:hypothetical protein